MQTCIHSILADILLFHLFYFFISMGNLMKRTLAFVVIIANLVWHGPATVDPVPVFPNPGFVCFQQSTTLMCVGSS